jgi:hypothetical protein
MKTTSIPHTKIPRTGAWSTLLFALALTIAPLALERSAEATPIRLTGAASWSRSGFHAYYRSVRMTGRFTERGAGRYWTRGSYRAGRMSNVSASTWSGSLSFELWGMRFFRGNNGFILRTRGYGTLEPGWGYPNPSSGGPLRRFNRYLWPMIGAAEWDRGWVVRSRVNFRGTRLM